MSAINTKTKARFHTDSHDLTVQQRVLRQKQRVGPDHGKAWTGRVTGGGAEDFFLTKMLCHVAASRFLQDICNQVYFDFQYKQM